MIHLLQLSINVSCPKRLKIHVSEMTQLYVRHGVFMYTGAESCATIRGNFSDGRLGIHASDNINELTHLYVGHDVFMHRGAESHMTIRGKILMDDLEFMCETFLCET